MAISVKCVHGLISRFLMTLVDLVSGAAGVGCLCCKQLHKMLLQECMNKVYCIYGPVLTELFWLDCTTYSSDSSVRV